MDLALCTGLRDAGAQEAFPKLLETQTCLISFVALSVPFYWEKPDLLIYP